MLLVQGPAQELLCKFFCLVNSSLLYNIINNYKITIDFIVIKVILTIIMNLVRFYVEVAVDLV